MSEAESQQEPSMEEILASIRRIISEDDKPEGKAEEEASSPEDVLELTEVAEEEAPEEEAGAAEEATAEEEAAPEEEPEAAEEPEEAAEEAESSIDDVLDEADDELELRDEDEAEPAAVAAPTVEEERVESSLIERETAAAAVGNLSSLVAAVDRAHGGTTLGDGNRTIEDLLKEVMRPMVKEWLDANLPALTERLVRREIERLARYADDD